MTTTMDSLIVEQAGDLINETKLGQGDMISFIDG